MHLKVKSIIVRIVKSVSLSNNSDRLVPHTNARSVLFQCSFDV
jgi:hypothetical protein